MQSAIQAFRPRPLFSLFIVWMFSTCLLAQTQEAEVAAIADSLMGSLHERGLFNGAVVMGRDGDPLYARGYGPANESLAVPFTPETASDGGSIAKTLAAASILMLWEEGRVDLDAPVRAWIPDYPHAGTTVRHLISHSAGLPDYGFFDAHLPADKIRTTLHLIEILKAHGVEPAFAPGTRFVYSSLGFDVAALIVERITGRPWGDFLQERVFRTLRMHNSFIRPARLSEWEGIRTMSYRAGGDSLVMYDVWDNEGFYGGSNIYFSAMDLFHWGRSFYADSLLGAAAMKEGNRPARIREGEAAGTRFSGINLLSWYYADEGRRYHYPGSLQGFWSHVYRDELQRFTIAYVSNNDIPQWIRPLLLRALIAIMEGKRIGSLEAPKLLDIDPQHILPIAGKYWMPGVGEVNIDASGPQPIVRLPQRPDLYAYFVGKGLYYIPGLDVWIGLCTTDEPYDMLIWLSVFHVAEGGRIR